MATAVHTKRYSEVFNSVTICSATFNLDVAADAAEVTTSCDASKAFLQGKYGWTAGNGGPADYAAAGADVTLFTNVTGGGNQTMTVKPSTAGVGATNPTYSGSAFVTSYGQAWDQAGAATMTTAYQGTSTLTRATS